MSYSQTDIEPVPQTASLGAIAPFFIVRSVRESVDFYVTSLGFVARFLSPEDEPFFAIVGRDSAQIYLKEILPDVAPLPNPGRHPWARWDAFVYVENPEALAAEFTARGVDVREPPENESDGLLGFEVSDRDGYVLYFGRPQ